MVLARVLLHVLARVIIHVHDYYLKTCDLGTLGHWDIGTLGHGEGEKIQWLSLAICGRAGWGPPAHLILLTDASHRFRICISFSDE